MSELAEVAGLAPTELSRVVAGLVSDSLIRRGNDPRDSRVKLVSITRSGEALTRRVHRQATEDLRGVWSDFTHDEWHRFIDYLNRFESGLRRVRTGRYAPSPSRLRSKTTRARS